MDGVTAFALRGFQPYPGSLDSHDLGPAALVAGVVLLAAAAGVTVAYKRPLGTDTVKGILGRIGISFAGLALAVAVAIVLFFLGAAWAAGTVLVWGLALLMVIGLRGRDMQHPLPLLIVAWVVPAIAGWVPVFGWAAGSVAERSNAMSLSSRAMVPAVIITVGFLVWRLATTYATEGEVDIW